MRSNPVCEGMIPRMLQEDGAAILKKARLKDVADTFDIIWNVLVWSIATTAGNVERMYIDTLCTSWTTVYPAEMSLRCDTICWCFTNHRVPLCQASVWVVRWPKHSVDGLCAMCKGIRLVFLLLPLSISHSAPPPCSCTPLRQPFPGPPCSQHT